MWLKQSTAVTVKVGPFLDATDGVTEETALTIAQADIRLSKNGGAFAQTNNVAGATHDENGYYGVPLDATDTGTLGTLRVAIHETGALPVWQDFMVVPSNVWDSFFGADNLEVDVTLVGGAAQDIATATALGTVDTNVDAILVDTGTTLQAEVDGIQADTEDIQSRLPAALVGGRMAANAEVVGDKTGYSLSAAGIQAIWDALTSALTTAGSIGKLLVDNINATIGSRASQTTADAIETDTQDIQSRLPAALVGGRMDSDVGAKTGNVALSAQEKLDVSDEVDSVLNTAVPSSPAAGSVYDLVTKNPDVLSLANIKAEVDSAFTTQMADSVPAVGAIATREQALYIAQQVLTEFAINGTTLTVKKPDGTTLMTFTLDDAATPTSLTRAT